MTKNVEKRPQWGNRAEFLLTCIGYAVGLGNIWRFPYILQKNGGGAFLVPYFIMLFLEGIPLLYVELTVGQLLQAGSVEAWRKVNPYVGGIGICSVGVSFFVAVYYNTIITWCIWYICNSFQEPLPWEYCPLNENRTAYVHECAASSTSQYFWYRETLNITPKIETSGGLQIPLLACLILAWIAVFICISKGISSSGKVVYFTATFPYFVLAVFLVRGLTLEGASTGVTYLFSANTDQLSDPSIWLDAATQIFFSLGIGFGGMIAFSSYNPKDTNIERDAIVISLVNSFTSILASVVVFSVLGFKATVEYNECIEYNVDILLDEFDQPQGNITVESYDKFIKENNVTHLDSCGEVEDFLDTSASGAGLAFIVIADAIVNMPEPQFWSFLWFLMLFCLGIDSMFGTIEGVITPLQDIGVLKKGKQIYTTCVVIVVCFFVSLTFVQGSGSYWLDVFDAAAAGLPLLVIAFFEMASIGWIFRYDRYDKEVIRMIGDRKNWFTKGLGYYWWATVSIIGPILLLTVFVGFVYGMVIGDRKYSAWQEDLGYNVDKDYPTIAVAVGGILACACTLWIPGVAAYEAVRRFMIRPTAEDLPPSSSEMNDASETNVEVASKSSSLELNVEIADAPRGTTTGFGQANVSYENTLFASLQDEPFPAATRVEGVEVESAEESIEVAAEKSVENKTAVVESLQIVTSKL